MLAGYPRIPPDLDAPLLREAARALGDLRERFDLKGRNEEARVWAARALEQRRRARVWGFAGWLFWLVVHLAFLTGFKNRVSALFHWTISFFGRSRPERTITAQQIFARQALDASIRGGHHVD